MTGLESLALADYSLCIKAGVHFTLCGGTVAKLGSAAHHEVLIPKLDSLELPGCFGALSYLLRIACSSSS